MANVIIDGKHNGKRLSVSIDAYLFDLFSCVMSSPRKFISQNIANGSIVSSASAREIIYQKIVKPSVIKRYADMKKEIKKT